MSESIKIIIRMADGLINEVVSTHPGVQVIFGDDDVEGVEDEAVANPYSPLGKPIYYGKQDVTVDADYVRTHYAAAGVE